MSVPKYMTLHGRESCSNDPSSPRVQDHAFADAILASFDKMYKAAAARLEPPGPVPAELPPPAAEAKVKLKSVKMPKPKAREPNKREMSLQEQDMLRQGLESLPEENMLNMLQIVRKRYNYPEMLGDEIELGIDEMDVETQWKLGRFVTNFNKAIKKSQRAAMTNGSESGSSGDTASGAGNAHSLV